MDDSPRHNAVLLRLADHVTTKRAANDVARLTKSAVVPAGAGDPSGGGGTPPGGMPGGDPSGGAAAPPPMDPSGGAGTDPTAQAIIQALTPLLQGGGAGGKGAGGKKAEQMILSTQIRNLTFLCAQMAEKMGVQVPPSMMVGPPADPATEQMAQQDMAGASSVPTLSDPSAQPAGGDPATAGAAPPAGPQGPQPVQPMDPSQGPIGKAAALRDRLGIGTEYPNPPDVRIANGGVIGSPVAARLRYLTQRGA